MSKYNINLISIQAPSKKSLGIAAILGLLIGVIAFAPIWFHNNGQYMDYGDCYFQYVPFIRELKQMLASGSLSWSWNSFLGDSFIGAYSYYTIFNPFAWLVALFPDNYILYGTMFVTLLKLSISMISSMLYIRLFCKMDSYALIGALLYTFSGFTLVNTSFYFFMDVIAIFPFLMYGLELLIRKRKRTIYVLFLMLNAAINYYFFVSTVFLVIIYLIFRLELYKFSSWKKEWETFLYIVLYSIIGTCLASIALIPSFYAILGSGKATESIGTGLELLYYPQKILEHIRTLVAPIESGRYHVFFDSSAWSSTAVYLPVFGCYCVLQWCLSKKDWLKKLCIVLMICYFIPVLNAVFNLFSSTEYTRWLYGMALIFSLVTVLNLEELDCLNCSINRKFLFILTLFTMGLLLIPTLIYFMYFAGFPLVNRFASACTTEYFMGYDKLIIMLLLTTVNYSLLWYIASVKNYKRQKVILIVIMGSMLNYGVYNSINYDLHATEYSNNYYYQKALIEGVESTDKDFKYRIDYPNQITNYGLFKNMPSVNYYNSLQNPKSSRFAQAVGIGDDLKDTILYTPANGNEYTNALLSVKYYYDYDGNSDIPKGFHYLRYEKNVYIYENENYIPMGFIYDKYCLEEQLKNISPQERARIMLETMVVEQSDEEIVSNYLSLKSDINEKDNFSDMISKRKETVCNYFVGTTKGFQAEITLDKDNIVFLSIPNDLGWEINVNGQPAKVINVNYGLMGICCKAGSNVISATYHTQGLMLGVTCSIACLVIWLILELGCKFLKGKKVM